VALAADLRAQGLVNGSEASDFFWFKRRYVHVSTLPENFFHFV
jgi:hypothetical protein